MCDLIKNSKAKSFTGYKIAAKIEEKYYSPAMGCEYTVGKVKPVKVQECLGYGFCEDILTSDLFKSNMTGRTTVLKLLRDARRLYGSWNKNFSRGTLVILRMTIKGELMNGEYTFSKKVVGGKEIVSIKEVK